MSEFNRHREEELEEMENTETNDEEQVAETVEETSTDEITALQDKIDELNDLLLRNRAELENFKRRTNEERIKERKYCLQDILTELVDIIDIFDSALNTQTDDEKLSKFLFGFKMISDRYKQVLENYGVKKIDALNQKFDSNVHYCASTEVNDEVEADTVIKVMMNGYMYKDRVLKPSMVIVSKKSEE